MVAEAETFQKRLAAGDLGTKAAPTYSSEGVILGQGFVVNPAKALADLVRAHVSRLKALRKAAPTKLRQGESLMENDVFVCLCVDVKKNEEACTQICIWMK